MYRIRVLFTAFSHKTKANTNGLTLHLLNRQRARAVRITGLPAAVGALNRVCTAQGIYFQKLKPLTPAKGELTLNVPARALISLTTLPVKELP